MEEYIKILEKDINYNKRQIKEIGSYIPFDIKLMKRVENLIKGYRALEEENKELLEVKISASVHNRMLELEKNVKKQN